MKKFQKALFVCVITSAVLFPVFAEHISFSADTMTGTAGDKSDTTKLEGGAYVLTESMEISADSIEMSGKNFRYITAEGKITGKNSESKLEFSCGSMSYDRETKIATLKDSVHLEDIENKVSADAQVIEYNQNTDVAVLQIDITLKQKDNVCSGAYAVYRKKDKMLELSGNSQIQQGKDTFRAQEITLNLDTQEITLDGRVKGSVVDERPSPKKDETQPAPAPETPEKPLSGDTLPADTSKPADTAKETVK